MLLFASYRYDSDAGGFDVGNDARVRRGIDDPCGGGRRPKWRRVLLFAGLHALYTGTVQRCLSARLPELHGRGVCQGLLHQRRNVLCGFGLEVVPGTEPLLCGQFTGKPQVIRLTEEL